MNVKGRKQITYEESHKDTYGILYKLCNRCEKWFHCVEEYFYRNAKSPDGLHPTCKVCSRLKANEYNKEHHEEHLDNCKTWYEKNKEIHLARSNAWNENNREYVRDRFKKYTKSEQGKIIMGKHTKQRYSNKKHEITEEQWHICKEYFKNENEEHCCAYCGLTESEHKKLFKQQLHNEHVDYEGSNTIENCIPSCKICNSKKHLAKLLDWYNENNPIYTEEKLMKIFRWTIIEYKKAI